MFGEDPLDSYAVMDVDSSPPSMAHMITELGQTERLPETTPEEIQAALRESFESMLIRAMQETHLRDMDPGLPDEEGSSGESDQDVDDEDVCVDLDVTEPSGYFPYPNKAVMLLDILDNMPRCRFTDTQMSLILHLAKKLGAAGIPSLKGLRKIQKTVQAECGHKPLHIVSHLGNVFYMNDVRDAIANDFANPRVAPHLQCYFHEKTRDISETYQAERLQEYSPEQLTPMFSKGAKHFWINELARLQDGRFIIPETWIVRDRSLEDGTTESRLTTDALIVTQTLDGCWAVTGEDLMVDADDLELDFIDILAMFGPNIDDEDLVIVMVTPWADDVSGNKSKQYNKHMNMYAQNTCLPGRLLQQEFHFAAFRDHVKSTEKNPVRCFNAHTKRKCRCILRTPGLPADNPQQSEEASHIGGNGNHPCRKCHWGGTKLEKESTAVYHACHEPGIARNAAEIRAELQNQLRLATFGDSDTIETRQRSSGTKDKISQYWIDQILARVADIREKEPQADIDDIASRVQTWLEEQPGDKMNPLLDMTGLDPSQDTPVELLHTVLLGVIKYIWHFLHTSQWSDQDRHLLAVRLQSTDISGLHIPPIRTSYMMQYKNNLIGKHYKTVMQALSFHVHDICTPEQFTLIKAAGDLGARLWVPEIDNMDSYIADLKIAIANVLDAWDAVDPLRIIVKIKLHLLTHIPDDIRRFGPSVRFLTEIQESYNSVFRACSIYSNRLSPSRDIGLKFASMNRVKHLLCGGFWFNSVSKGWISAGQTVQDVLMEDPVFQRHLGWVSSEPAEPGTIKLAALKTNPPLEWQSTKASLHWQEGDIPAVDTCWKVGQYVTVQNGDRASKTCWVFADLVVGNSQETVLGRVCEIISGTKGLVTLERFIYTAQRHPEFDWPLVRRPRGTEITQNNIDSFVVVNPASIRFVCSVQHDCWKGKCQPSIIGKERQEREETDRTICLIQHSDDDFFVLNMAGLHNFTNICNVLPRSLTELQLLHPDREAFHQEISTKAQSLGQEKRQKTAEKRRATAARKREAVKKAEEEAAAAEAAARRAEEQGDMDSDEEEGEEEHEPEPEQGAESEDIELDDGDEFIPARRRSKRKRQRT
ncbi:hypothetical protein DFH07DRAFT_949282 [Mycena maculata]|uniref:Uncharacterized protein n=1 Tax=Mycena maculata TaxID=230809 RepID=A0AAD7KC05_9AGAR|nr:hypothetical protein DFH07DRAFT_949282 [Mycena maculata]